MLLVAPLTPNDDDPTVHRKVRLVGRFVDILLNWRLWNFRSIAYSTMQYAMFLVMRDIRGLEVAALGERLYETLTRETETFASNDRLRVHQQNRYALHRLLARLTDHVETQSGQPSRYAEYVNAGTVRYEVEHIWADHPERHTGEFSHPTDFAEYRNRIGGLLLLPKSFNASYSDLPYEDKLPHYNTQNLLARRQCCVDSGSVAAGAYTTDAVDVRRGRSRPARPGLRQVAVDDTGAAWRLTPPGAGHGDPAHLGGNATHHRPP